MKKIALIIGLFALIACGKKGGDKQARLEELKSQQEKISAEIAQLEKELSSGQKTKMKEVNVTVSEVRPSSFKHYVEIQGKIESDQNVTITPKMPGTVTKVLVKAGDQVSEGQLLATLDNAVSQQGLQELESSLAFANSVYQKQKNLWEHKIGSEIQYLTAKNNKEALEKKLATMKEQADMANIKSPISGTVDEVMIKVGQAAAPGAPALRVVNLSNLKAKADVAEAYSSKVHKGSEVTVKLPDLNKTIDTKVSYAGKVINPLSRTFNMEVELNNDADLRPNMLAVLKVVDYKADSVISVPVNIVQNSEEGKYVMVASVVNGKKVAEKRIVEVGNISEGVAEIKKGLKPSDKVITTGFQDLDNGQPIKF